MKLRKTDSSQLVEDVMTDPNATEPRNEYSRVIGHPVLMLLYELN
jgi:hypothetical protein